MENPIHIFTKLKSRKRIEIHINWMMDPGGYFLDIRHVEKKSGKVTKHSTIIQKDLHLWTGHLLRDGWIDESTENKTYI